MTPILDPRLGDIEDDASSTKQRSLLGIAGTLLAEISLPKLLLSWTLMIVLPGVLLGVAPLIGSAWLATLSRRIAEPLGGVLPFLALIAIVAFGWMGGRPVVRVAERAFWSLNSLAVQPGYALCREALRHVADKLSTMSSGAEARKRVQAASAAGAGAIVCGIALLVVLLAWPYSRWVASIGEFAAPHLIIIPALANSAVVVGLYFAAVSLIWGVADATMDQPSDLVKFDTPPENARHWRVAHLSDLHVVGERYGFRIESGRSGPCGNDRLAHLLVRLEDVHAEQPLDLILISGDMTDAGRSTEWAEFLAALALHPTLAKLVLMLPGNHDVNVVDRTNPARLDLPTSPGKRLRQMRTLSAIAAIQGDRVRVVDPCTRRLGETLSHALAPYRESIAAFGDKGALRLSVKLEQVWADAFPMVLPPREPDGLGVILLNSVAEAHFSFTNALGLMAAEDVKSLLGVARQFTSACWIVALHHHLVEYPRPGAAFSERIGTALINGSWFIRQLASLGNRVVAMHGHRHIDWIGECGGIRIVSAPSPVMEATDSQPTYFHVHRLARGRNGNLALLPSQRIEIPGALAGSSVNQPGSSVGFNACCSTG